MQRMALILAIFLAGLTGALAQNVTVIGPITPGDCPQFNSTTVIKDGGFPCNGAAGGPAGGVLSGTYPNPSLNSADFANPTGAVGLTSVPGSASTIMRSDAAPALSAPVQSALTGTNNGVALGTGAFGFGSTAPGTNSQALFGNTGAAPAFRQPAFADLTGAALNAQITPGAANTVKGSVNGTTTSDLALASCSALYSFTQWVTGTGWQCGINPVLPSRAVAATINLSAFSAVTTQGYATPGDGGGATFKNVTASPFIDSFITTFTITGGSGYTNGSFFGVIWQTGSKPFSIGTATVSGGTVTAVNIAGTPGAQCHVGDVLTTSSLAGGIGASITVTGCSTPLGSFTDSAGNHWQLLNNQSYPNILQFGAVGDWNGTDGTATDNFNALQAAMWFAGFKSSTPQDAGGFWGGRLLVPQGSFMACGGGSTSLVVPQGVMLEGANALGSTIRMCSAFNNGIQFMTLCDINWHFAGFQCRLENLTLSAAPTVTVSGGVYMVFTNNGQDFAALDNVYIYSGGRGCVWATQGFGGASTGLITHNLSCNPASTLAAIKIGDSVGSGDNYGTTIINLQNTIIGGPSSGSNFQTGPGLLVQGGYVDIERIHCEEMPVCVEVSIPSGAVGYVKIENLNAGSGGAPAPTCTGQIQLDSGNTAGNAMISRVNVQSCTNVITNNQGGTTRTTAINPAAGWIAPNP